MQLCRIIYCSLTALHVSSDIFAHHQEHLNCIYSFWYYWRMSWPAGAMGELELQQYAVCSSFSWTLPTVCSTPNTHNTVCTGHTTNSGQYPTGVQWTTNPYGNIWNDQEFKERTTIQMSAVCFHGQLMFTETYGTTFWIIYPVLKRLYTCQTVHILCKILSP
jgi:hypothetical protein